MNPYKGVLLDLDNTLYEYAPVHEYALETVIQKASKKYGIPKDLISQAYSTARNTIHSRLKGTGSSHNRLLYFSELADRLNLPPEVAVILNGIYWKKYLKQIKFRKGAKKFLKLLKDKNIQICIVTDLTSDIQHRKIKKMKLYKYINKIVTSEEAGAEKPSKEIFLLALAKINLSPDEVCMIGDDPLKDGQGAMSLGIHAYIYGYRPENDQDDQSDKIRSFDSFPELMGIFA